MSIMNDNTTKTYRRIVRQVAKFTGKPAGRLTRADFEAFVADRVMHNYSPQSLNLYRAAANHYLASIGSDDRLPTYSAKHYQKLPERILNRQEVASLLDGLNPFYRAIAKRIYNDPTPPKTVLADTPSPLGGTVTAKTLGTRFRRISADWQHGPATPYALFVSGIIHALEDGRQWRKVQQSAQLADSTMQKYIRIAAGLPPGGTPRQRRR